MLQQDDEVIVIVIAGTIMLLLLGMFIISFLFFYQRKRSAHLAQQKQLQSEFQNELLKTQIEVQEQTLAYISGEIHDNITQVLSFIKLSLAMTRNLGEEKLQNKLEETRALVAQAINDLRDLSKSLSFEHITSMGLLKTIGLEVDRVNKSGLMHISVDADGEAYPLGEQRELVLFRIFQEVLNNALKHSGATHLKISLQYHSELFNLTLEDNGSGFSAGAFRERNGSGLKNIENRAALIGGIAVINSSPGKGCCVKVTLSPIKLQLDPDGDHSDRFS